MPDTQEEKDSCRKCGPLNSDEIDHFEDYPNDDRPAPECTYCGSAI